MLCDEEVPLLGAHEPLLTRRGETRKQGVAVMLDAALRRHTNLATGGLGRVPMQAQNQDNTLQLCLHFAQRTLLSFSKVWPPFLRPGRERPCGGTPLTAPRSLCSRIRTMNDRLGVVSDVSAEHFHALLEAGLLPCSGMFSANATPAPFGHHGHATVNH